MPLFMVKKEAFEWIRTGQKAKKDDNAVFQCERDILRGIIVEEKESMLTDVLRQDKSTNKHI